MSKKKGGFSVLFYKTIMPKVYGIGAAVVIIGALFKILHITGADLMLMLGLSVEAGIFFLSAFEPPHQEPDWSKVYPELAEDYEAPATAARISNKPGASLSSIAQIGDEQVTALKTGIQSLADNAKKLATIGSVSADTAEYAQNVKSASGNLSKMNDSYKVAIEAVSAMANASKDTGAYHAEVQKVTKNLAALNSVYEMELKDADSHVKNMNKFYESLTGAMQGLSKVGDNTAKFTSELGKLSDNLTALNKVYGSMLTAMKGGGQN